MKQVNALEIILDKSMSPLKVLSESFCGVVERYFNLINMSSHRYNHTGLQVVCDTQ